MHLVHSKSKSGSYWETWQLYLEQRLAMINRYFPKPKNNLDRRIVRKHASNQTNYDQLHLDYNKQKLPTQQAGIKTKKPTLLEITHAINFGRLTSQKLVKT